MKKIQKKISKQYFLIKLVLFVSLFIWIFNPFLSSKFSWWLFKYRTNKTKIKPTDVFLAYLLLLFILFQTLIRLNLDMFSRVNLKNVYVTKQLPNGHNTHIKCIHHINTTDQTSYVHCVWCILETSFPSRQNFVPSQEKD